MPRKLTQEEFLSRCKKAHGNKYDYSMSVYDGNNKKVSIYCAVHGEFSQTPNIHFQGHGCPACNGKKRVTKSDFIEKAKEVHGLRYDYSRSVFLGRCEKVEIKCAEHGCFWQSPKEHTRGQGCPKCGILKVSSYGRKSTLDFIKDSEKNHGNRYDYSKAKYISNKKPVIIICRKHGQFRQIAADHLKGAGCPLCWKDRRSLVLLKSTNQFILDSENIHGKRYDYSRVCYINSRQKVNIVCSIHGGFFQNPSNHINGDGCPRCGDIVKGEKTRSNTLDFIEKAKKIHNFRYDYSLVNYKSAILKVKINCKDHGLFMQTPSSHLFGQGCPKCKASKLELKTRVILEKYELEYKEQKKFDKCRYIKPLSFDFYLPDYNIVIECQGRQHYNQIPHWGGQKGYFERNIRDMIKKNYCKREGIQLIEIPYWKGSYEEIDSLIKPVLLPAIAP